MKDELIPMFTPLLSALLTSKEDAKGSPLSEDEVLDIRDNAIAIMVRKSDYERMGRRDLDPENCWYDWQMLRRELGRQPDLDPGTKVTFSPSDSGIEASIATAQGTLDHFIQLIGQFGYAAFPSVKVYIEDGEARINMWLSVEEILPDGFGASFFEVPTTFQSIKMGDRFRIPRAEVQDWMIHENGTLHGGFSLRVQREHMSDTEKAEFDQHIGAERYADIP
ncbi:hypothetical protein Rhal01_02545 [Rubritalea halochordaticola]|uniref:DUF2314 domain-containing protein n=1 Tax=Rubritalea halochordaticola TaxID=714537 RepID=A0ABP9V128_9BACT